MPWNCLCSAKEKRKIEISGPILNPDDSLQLLPLKQQNAQVVASGQRHSSEQQTNGLRNSKNNKKNGTGGINQTCNASSKGKRAGGKNQNNEPATGENVQKNNNNNHDEIAVAKPGKKGKSAKQFVSVKFSFDKATDKVHDSAAATTVSLHTAEHLTDADDGAPPRIALTQPAAGETKNGLVGKIEQLKSENAGNYDEIPPFGIANAADRVNSSRDGSASSAHQQHQHSQLGGARSNDSIPFIDDDGVLSKSSSPQRNLHQQNEYANDHDVRFLTLHPKNVGSTVNRQQSHAEYLRLVTQPPNSKLTAEEQENPATAVPPFDHDFQLWQFPRGKLCQLCHEPMAANFIAFKCRSCELTCHEWCASSMVNSRTERPQFAKNHDDQSREQHTIPKSQSFPVQTKPHQQSSGSLRLHYVTQRILASVLPRRDPENNRDGGGGSEFEDKHEKEIISMLEQKHGKNYRVFDLESCISVITLERICELCKHIDSWLGGGQEKVVVLQDRDDRQRLGAAIAAYLEYLDICSSNYTIRNGTSNEDLRVQNTIARNWLDLDIFSMKKFLEDFIGPLRIPSHNRYLRYFSGLLSGKIRMNSSPLHLKHVTIESPPTWMQYSRLSAQSSEWVTFIKIYEGLRCVYTSDIHIIPITTRQFLYQIGCLRLRGDILIRCYHINSPENGYSQETRELLFSVQFHTCAITSKDVTFGRNDLDLACDDPRFPSDHKVLLHFSSGGTNENGLVFQSPLIRTEPPNELAKFDSIENFDINSSYHTQGPLDGSLYATILKSPKSPQIPYPFPNPSPRSSSSQHRESLGQNLISPPPQFSNKQQQQQQQQHYELVERRPSSVIPSRDTVDRREILTQTTNSTKLQNSHPKSDYSYVDIRPSTSQSNYRDSNKYNTTSGNPNQHHQHYPPETRQITIVETYNSTTDGHQNYQNGGRESVRSPLTLSMDSGISSSGLLNRPQQGSSVSPSSFPSQASPQEDRHRELDDILSDMLMTVQDIPDFGKSKQAHQHQIVRSQSVIPTTGNYALPAYNGQQQSQQYNTVKRSQSYVVQDATSTSQNSYLAKDRQDFYDTSSTTTTLTPPPSESGRDTPIQIGGGYSNAGSISNISTLQHRQTLQREKRDAFLSPGGNQQSQHPSSQHHQQQMIMQHQSSPYPQTERTENVVVSASEDEEIPYHAREHSQPFSYGSVPANSNLRSESPIDPAMIKMQSGLSSPSLVRKTLGRTPSPSTLRKTTPRNDFEEMLRDSREKIKNEKYSIGDRSTINNTPDLIDRSYGSENKWVNSSAFSHQQHSQSNGYHHYNEPLRRSNTMDGGFARSNSTDGISGQTWLQLQQQKLRAKKDQQQRDDRRYFEEVIHTEIKNRPLRSRPNNGQRFDGYSSDTAAFTDEVDFRRPLHVQTPYNPNRASERNYHTLTSTTTTVTQKERPFVAIKRAHELAKQQNATGVREESFSSYRSETDPELSIAGSPRPETPAFPVTPRTPYGLTSNGNVSPALPPKSPTSLRRFYNSTWSLRSQKSSLSSYDVSKDLYSGNQKGHLHEVVNQNDTISCYASRRNSNASNANSEPQEIAPHLVKFVRDSSKYWYKPNISREEAVAHLRNAEPGTFVVRDSTTFKNAFGLVLRVAHPPPGVQVVGPPGDELVRHFLVEPTSRGVRLKGCANEPVFSSLSALVYQHSIMPLALPCRLIIPDRDIQSQEMHTPAQRQLLAQGAACNVLYLYTCDTESLTGEEAVRKAVSQLFAQKPLPTPTEVHYKVAHQGITLTDNTRQKFFRKHYSANHVSFCGLDPEKRTWSIPAPGSEIPVNNKTIFAFVARRSASSKDNQCHLFCDLQSNQPALAIVAFANKVLPTEKLVNHHI